MPTKLYFKNKTVVDLKEQVKSDSRMTLVFQKIKNVIN